MRNLQYTQAMTKGQKKCTGHCREILGKTCNQHSIVQKTKSEFTTAAKTRRRLHHQKLQSTIFSTSSLGKYKIVGLCCKNEWGASIVYIEKWSDCISSLHLLWAHARHMFTSCNVAREIIIRFFDINFHCVVSIKMTSWSLQQSDGGKGGELYHR